MGEDHGGTWRLAVLTRLLAKVSDMDRLERVEDDRHTRQRRQIRQVAAVLLWGVVALETFGLIRRHLRPEQTVVEWIMFILLATLLTIPDRYPRKVTVPIAFLTVAMAGYGLYLSHVTIALLWIVLAMMLPAAIWIGLRRWATWRWAKNPWVGLGIMTAGTGIALVLILRLSAK